METLKMVNINVYKKLRKRTPQAAKYFQINQFYPPSSSENPNFQEM